MISISKIIKKLFSVVFLAGLFLPGLVTAQESLTLSVSPTLFEMTANPDQYWSSTVRVINGNAYDITVFIETLNFEPQGEGGQVKFLPLFEEETDGKTLAEWIFTESAEVTISAEQSMDIPFSIKVPDDAPPGGHFAAILVGTKSLDSGSGKTVVETSQVVTSLVFLRVTGDIKEIGSIREFRSVSSIVESPEMEFELRFENKGNVQILPQGEIRIFNMWGQERGLIPVNRQTMFGNVLPNQIRKYKFSWSGEWSVADMGRYRAVATLAYGEEGRQFASSETAFWVIPWKVLLIVLSLLIAMISLVTWAIKIYIRKMLSMAGVSPGVDAICEHSVQRPVRKVSVVAPIEEGILDLSNNFRSSETWSGKISSVFVFIKHYKFFFFVLFVILLSLVVVVLYVRSASVSERPYEVTVNGLEKDVTISSEQVEYEDLKDKTIPKDDIEMKDFPAIKIVNQSGVSGLAAKLRLKLESEGYEVTVLENDLDNREAKSVIVYAPEFADEVLGLSKYINDVPVSAYGKASESDTPVTIYLGEDFENEL